MHLAGNSWLLRHLQLVLSLPMLLLPASSHFFSSSASINASSSIIRSSSCSRRCFSPAVKFILLLSQAQHTSVLSFNLLASVFCKEKFPLSLDRCLRTSASGNSGRLRSRLGFRNGFNGNLKSFRFQEGHC